MENIQKLLSVLEMVENHCDQQTAQWFKEGCRLYLSGEQNTLEKAFKFSSTAGKYKARTIWQRSERDNYIRQAYSCIDPAEKPTLRCELLADQIRAFESRIYPRIKHFDQLPADMSDLRKLLWKAKKTGAGLPNGWRSVYRCIYGY